MRARLRRYFFTGLIVFLPIAITLSFLLWLFRTLDRFLGWLFTLLLGEPIPGLGLVATIAVIFLIGALTTNVLGRRLVGWFDRLMLRIPLARSIYSATKQLSDSIFLQRRAAFQRAVLVEWPRQGMYTVGFVTGETGGRTQEIAGRRVLNVFVMSTPNPTTGFLALVPEDQVYPLDMSVEEGIKLMMSGGIVAPSRSPRSVSVEPGGHEAP
ncbi:MAG: DUF502 domain-containing protein [Bacillati bacterium ANGP1]|uniref:DUF502 domain-containing protein n=1 Tax=Candidatus Segetimicrobium genomatis TaxID=2569760 RepID=A0A537L4W8_9BACT|nr:MAG: DUF502 domain-containing protein [Terrabacteria group bacterium ANGP1]